jgi:hypothetical protein
VVAAIAEVAPSEVADARMVRVAQLVVGFVLSFRRVGVVVGRTAAFHTIWMTNSNQQAQRIDRHEFPRPRSNVKLGSRTTPGNAF